MKKLKRLLVAITIIVIIFTFFTNIAFSARAYQMNKSKGLVYIDGGEDEGFILGATVCFISCSGEELICGTVQKTSPSEAVVKVDNRATKMRKICQNEALLYVEEKEEVKKDEENEEKKKEPERINKKDWFK
ncbi:MAG TPA: hypothetical protein VMW06_09000 [Desulfobacterales bacterium]|nr:hypothetical protein [Desulfobacterales bacterium]HUX98562.1 hypothetical protein [Candidatus Deferrimicrobium sp.]